MSKSKATTEPRPSRVRWIVAKPARDDLETLPGRPHEKEALVATLMHLPAEPRLSEAKKWGKYWVLRLLDSYYVIFRKLAEDEAEFQGRGKNTYLLLAVLADEQTNPEFWSPKAWWLELANARDEEW